MVDSADSDGVASTIGSADRTHVVLENSGHLATLATDRRRLFDASMRFIDRLAGRT